MRQILKLLIIVGILLSAGKALAQEQNGSITVYLQNVQGCIAVYPVDDLRETDPQVLQDVVMERQIQGITKPVIPHTPTTFTGLPQGRYLVTHGEAAFRPFLVTIPITVSGTTSFAVEARPKTLDQQTPQTSDFLKLYPLLTTFLVSLLGVILIITIKWKDRMTFLDKRMFLRRVQNKQKRLP